MNYFFNKLELFFNKPFVEQVSMLFGLLFLIFLFPEGEAASIQKLVFIFPAIILFFIKDEKSKKYFWLLSGIIYFIDILTDYTLLSNHNFLFGYMSFSLFFSYLVPSNNQEKFIKKQFLWAFAIVMFFSGLQKLLSAAFMDGSFLSYLFVKGSFGGFMLNFFKEKELLIMYNTSALSNFSNTEPSKISAVVFNSVIPLFHQYAKYFSWLIVFVELLIGIIIIPFHKNKISHFLILFLVLGILFSRYETGFLALISTLLFFTLSKDMRLFRYIYFIVIILCISLILVGLGKS